MKQGIRKTLSTLLIVSFVMSLVSCAAPYGKNDIIYEYDSFNCLYYSKNEYKKYKYSDYIFDDVSNGLYKTSTPNIADYKTGNGLLDYDIEAYVEARMNYAIKNDLISKYETRVDSICASVHDDYYEQKIYHIHYYDKTNKKDVLLYDGPATNIAYDDEVPTVSFDIPGINEEEERKAIEGRRIMLSDIIASNTTLEGYMRVILGSGKDRMKFFMDRRVDDIEFFNVASVSEAVK